MSRFVQQMIVNPPGGANISEWCKKEKCWQTIRDYDHDIPEALQQELLSVARPVSSSIQTAVSITDGVPRVWPAITTVPSMPSTTAASRESATSITSINAGTEDSGTDADHRRPRFDGDGIIVAHAP